MSLGFFYSIFIKIRYSVLILNYTTVKISQLTFYRRFSKLGKSLMPVSNSPFLKPPFSIPANVWTFEFFDFFFLMNKTVVPNIKEPEGKNAN